MMNILPSYIYSMKFERHIIDYSLKCRIMDQLQPLSTIAKLALADYQKKGNYLKLRDRDYLQLIRQAAVCQIAKDVPQAKQYKGLLDNVDSQIAYRKQKKATQKSSLNIKFSQKKQHREQHGKIGLAQQLYQQFLKLFQAMPRKKIQTVGHGEDISSQEQSSFFSQELFSQENINADVAKSQKTKKQKDQKRKAKLT